MTSGFNQVLESMAQADFFTGILPFLISYIIFFTMLQRMPFWPEDGGSSGNVDKNKFSAIISVALSLYVSYFMVNNPAYQSFFSEYFGIIIIGILGILGFMMLLAIAGVDLDNIRTPILALLVIVGAISAFILSGGILAFVPGDTVPAVGLDMSQISSILFDTGLIWVIVVGAAIYWVTKSEGSDRDASYWWTPWDYPRDDDGNPSP